VLDPLASAPSFSGLALAGVIFGMGRLLGGAFG